MQHEAWYLLVIWLISTEVESVMAAWERTCTPFTKSFGPHPRGICGRRIDETLSLLCMGDYYQSPSYYRRKRETLTESECRLLQYDWGFKEAYVELCVNIYSGILKARSLELDIAYNNDLYHGRTNGISRARYVPQSTGLSNVPRTGLFTTVESMNEMMKTVGGGCKNFLKLCKVKYYNFCLFHSIQRNLVAQTGDPTGTGKGGESVYGLLYGEQAKYFDAEVSPRIKHKNVGTVSMVNNGNSRHGSQFFITLGEDLDYLDNVHTVFGEVAEGLDVLMKINEAYCDKEHRPYKDIRIYHTVILDDPYDDPTGLDVPDKSPEPTKEQLDSGRIGAEEDINDFEGMTEAEIQEIIEEREAKANAQILTMVGDIPEEDIAPPENVLFVCKLNPVTTDEDLEIIFSRFGHIKSCEVIRDQKTKESLQYAFIEFEKPEECENAYFKMDNVLIDDRRIHVDFSQSVAKYKWKGKGRGVEILKEDKKDDFSSKFTIKDNTRKDDRYSLVFEEEEVRKDSKKKKKKKHKTKHDSDSDSEQGKEKKSKHKKHKPERSRSPKEDKERYRKHSPIQSSYRDRSQRSRSPDHRNRSQRSRSPEYTDKRRRSPPSEYRDKHRRSSSPEYREKRKRRSPSPEYRDKRRKSPSPEYRDKYQYRERDRQRDYEKSKYRDSEKYKDRRNR